MPVSLLNKTTTEIGGQVDAIHWDQLISDVRNINLDFESLKSRLSETAAIVSDWNLITKSGHYMSSETAANLPSISAWFIGNVIVHSNIWQVQEIVCFSGNDEVNNTMSYRREKNNGTWTSWQKIYKTKGELDQEYVTKSGTQSRAGDFINNGNALIETPSDANLSIRTSGVNGGSPHLSFRGGGRTSISYDFAIGAGSNSDLNIWQQTVGQASSTVSHQLKSDGHIWTSQYGWLHNKFVSQNTDVVFNYVQATSGYAGFEARATDVNGYGYLDLTSANRQTDYDWRTLSSLNGVDYQLWYGNPANTNGHGQLGDGHKYTLNANGHIWTSGYGWLHDKFLDKTNAIMSSQLTIVNNNPTIHLKDTDNPGWAIHSNGGTLHFLPKATNADGWGAPINGRWPATLDQLGNFWAAGDINGINLSLNNGIWASHITLTGYIYSGNWFRSNGNTGWYSETYGGGIWMIDTTWVRTYNGKKFLCDNEILCSGNITAYSDERLKDDIKPIENALDKVCQIQGVTYIDKRTNESRTGVIAQNLLQVDDFKLLVREGDLIDAEDESKGKYLGVDYGNALGLLIESIKELKLQNDDLRREVNLLKGV